MERLGEVIRSEFSVRLNGPILRATYTRFNQAILRSIAQVKDSGRDRWRTEPAGCRRY